MVKNKSKEEIKKKHRKKFIKIGQPKDLIDLTWDNSCLRFLRDDTTLAKLLVDCPRIWAFVEANQNYLWRIDLLWNSLICHWQFFDKWSPRKTFALKEHLSLNVLLFDQIRWKYSKRVAKIWLGCDHFSQEKISVYHIERLKELLETRRVCFGGNGM